MSQYNLPDFTSPQPGGTFLKENLEPWRDAVHSGHMGNTRPSYVVQGMWWIDNTSTPWVAKIFQGSDDIIMGTLDPMELVFIPSGVEVPEADGVTYDNTSSGLDADNVQDAIDEVVASMPDVPTAEDVTYDNAASGLNADNVQDAIDELQEIKLPLICVAGTILSGLEIANNSTDMEHDIDIAAGSAISLDGVLMTLTSGITKQLDVTFSEGDGNGGFASGESLPTDGTIHIWLISKPDGTTDIFANDQDASGLDPVLPAGFTVKKRIASLITDNGSNLSTFHTKGDNFYYTSRKLDRSGTPSSTAGQLVVTSVPKGIEVIGSYVINSGGGVISSILITSVYEENSVPGDNYRDGMGANAIFAMSKNIVTNELGEIRYRVSNSDTNVRIFTIGYNDDRIGI